MAYLQAVPGESGSSGLWARRAATWWPTYRLCQVRVVRPGISYGARGLRTSLMWEVHTWLPEASMGV